MSGRNEPTPSTSSSTPVIGGSLRVPWDDLDPKKYEDLVAAMLSLEHPTSRRIDGAGGDGGCDVAFPGSDGLEIFELKSWPGRVNTSRRRQVARSLAKAQVQKPVAWHVVAPVDLTPKEQAWFDGMVAEIPFPCDWRGRTWLDARIAAHPQLVRYFCGSASDALVEMMRDFNQEQAALAGGLTDGVERLRSLAERINDLNPFHQVRIEIDGGDVAISSQPRYPGAEEDGPMTITATFVFPATDEGRAAAELFRRFIDYGDPIEVGPEYIEDMKFSELLGDQRPAEYRFSGGGDQTVDIPATVAIFPDIDSEDDVIASLPMRFTAVRGGQVGTTAVGKDVSGALTLTAVLDRAEGYTSVNLNFNAAGVTPQAALAACHLLALMRAGRAIGIRFDETGELIGPFTFEDDIEQFVMNAELVTDLAELQRRTGHVFATPAGLTSADHDDVREALALLNGETITETWNELTLQGIASKVPELLEAADRAGDLVAMSASDLDLAGHRIPLGVLVQTFIGATPADAAGALDAASTAGPDGTIPVRFVPCGEPVKTLHRVEGARRVEDVKP